MQPWNVTSEPQMTPTLEGRENTLEVRNVHEQTENANVYVTFKIITFLNVVLVLIFSPFPLLCPSPTHQINTLSLLTLFQSVPFHHLFLPFTYLIYFFLFISLSLQGAIIIHEVYEEGAASKDGRLWAGDQILEVRCSVMSITCHLDK